MTYDLDKNRPLQSWKSGFVDGRVDLAADAESINRADQHGMAVGPDAIVHGPLRHRAGHRVGWASHPGRGGVQKAASGIEDGIRVHGCGMFYGSDHQPGETARYLGDSAARRQPSGSRTDSAAAEAFRDGCGDTCSPSLSLSDGVPVHHG